MPPPDWLPAMARISPWTVETFEYLYAIFARDFKDTRPLYEGRPVWFFPEVEDGKETIFWHMTTRNDRQTATRLPDLRRSERLPWVRPMIEHAGCDEGKAWDYQEADGSLKTYVWLEDQQFVVIMKKYPDGGRRLLTSFYVDYPHYRRKLLKKYERRA